MVKADGWGWQINYLYLSIIVFIVESLLQWQLLVQDIRGKYFKYMGDIAKHLGYV